MIPKGNPNPSANRDRDDFPGYPHYDSKEDLYKNADELQNVDPERPDREKKPNLPPDEPIKAQEAGEFIEGSNQPGSQEFPDGDEDDDEGDIDDDDDDDDLGLDDDDDLDLDDTERAISRGKRAGEDLDVPGAELDDDLEELGSEDEENNYYSLGGDNHEA